MTDHTLDYEKIREYRTKGDKYCLVLSSGEHPALPYQVNMIRYNQIGNLLPIQFFMEDGKYQYYYDISHTESMAVECSYKKLKWDQVLLVLMQLYKTVARMEDFLLELDGLLLLPEYIYWNEDRNEYWFCYYPDKEESFEHSLWELLEYFLNHIDYKDDYTVKMVYDLYQKVRKEHVPLAKIIEIYGNTEQSIREEEKNEEIEENYEEAWETESVLSLEVPDKTEGILQKVIPYIPDLIGALLVARMAYYLMENHATMTGLRFLLWLGGILMIVALSAAWASYLGKKEVEEKEISVENNPSEKRVKRQIRTEAEKDTEEAFPSAKHRQEHLYPNWTHSSFKNQYEREKMQDEPIYEEEHFCGKEILEQNKNLEKAEAKVVSDHPFKDGIPKTLVMKQEVLIKGRYPVLVAQDKKSCKDIVLSKKQMVIGKVRGFVDVCLEDACISRVHAQINQEEGGTTIMDLGSTNGSYVNGRKLGEQERMLLHHGDEVMLAGLCFQFLQDFS